LSFRFKDFEIDVARQELRRAGAIVHIEPQVFDLLVHLVRNRDRIVSRDELIDAVWQGRIVSDATLSSRISSARRALGDSGNDQNLIRTLHRRGFRFVGEVDETSVLAAFGIGEAPSAQRAAHDVAKIVPSGEALPLLDEPSVAVAPLHNIGRHSNQVCLADGCAAVAVSSLALSDRASTAAANSAILPDDLGVDPGPVETETKATGRRTARSLLLAAAVIGLGYSLITAAWWLRSLPSPSSTKASLALASDTEAPVPRPKARGASMLVLPFINLSGDATRDHVVDGITDSLISDLVRALPGVSIASRDTAFTYKDRGTDPRQVGRELGVRYLREGSVVLEGERARVNTRLVETKDGGELWAERFDAERKSILQVQDEIVGRVSRAIGLQVVDIEARRSASERPGSAELFDLVMRGKAVLNKPTSAATMIEARGLFEQALTAQPANIDALAGVAATLVFEFLNGYYEAGGDNRLRQADMLLDRALAIESRHLTALKAKAALRRAQGKFDDAIATAEAVIMENPGEPWAYKEIGLSTLYLGRPEHALEWFAKAERIGPRDPGRWTWLDGRGHALILLGRDDEAIRALISALDANPRNAASHAFLAAAYALLGRFDEARASLDAFNRERPGMRISKFRTRAPVPLVLTSPKYQQQRERLNEGLRLAGMPE
jgi:TolB-like protein/tetratricopeptide (TPR) repeat protein